MDVQNLIDRIAADAKAETKVILHDARTNAKENIAYAKSHAEQVLKETKESAKTAAMREQEITEGEREIRERLETLRAKTAIVGGVFDTAMDKVKFNFRTEKKQDCEVRLTKQVLGEQLREEIESEVVKILFEEARP